MSELFAYQEQEFNFYLFFFFGQNPLTNPGLGCATCLIERSPAQRFKYNFWDSLLTYTKYIATPKNQKKKIQNFQKTKKTNLLQIQ